ncbi:MFS transporter [Streptomyces melanosporofaciens]
MSFGIVLARLPAGVLADRYERRTLLLACNTIGALVLGALSILEASNASGTNALLVAAFLLGSVGSTLAPAENVAIRNFVDADLVPRALALIQSRAGVAMIAGPLAGGVLLRVDAAWVFAADAGTYLVAVGCVALLPAGAGARSEDQPPMKAAVEGLRFLWRSPFLRYGALSATVLNLVFNGLLIVIIASAEDSGAGDLGVGVQTAALGAGALVGSLVAAPVARRLPPGTEHRLFHGCRRRGAARVRDGPRHLGRRPPAGPGHGGRTRDHRGHLRYADAHHSTTAPGPSAQRQWLPFAGRRPPWTGPGRGEFAHVRSHSHGDLRRHRRRPARHQRGLRGGPARGTTPRGPGSRSETCGGVAWLTARRRLTMAHRLGTPNPCLTRIGGWRTHPPLIRARG